MQSGTFTLDAPLGANVRVVAHCADEADLDTVEVVSPNGRVYDLPLVSDGMLHIRIPHTDEVTTIFFFLRRGGSSLARIGGQKHTRKKKMMNNRLAGYRGELTLIRSDKSKC